MNETLGIIVGGSYIGLWLFFIYGLVGVIIEMVYCWTIEYRGVIESRLGLLYVPFNLLYGAGGLFISLALLPVVDNPFAVFGVGLLVGTALEYLTSLLMEKLFHAVYWDYSKEFLNVQGRICLKYAIIWGLLSLVLLYVFDAVNVQALAEIPVAIGLPVLFVLIVATVFSVVLTLLTYRRTRQKNAWLLARRAGDADAALPMPWWGRMVDALVPDSVLVNTFPRLSLVAEYQELSGHHRKLVFWLPAIGRPSAETARLGDRAREAEAARLLAAVPSS
ncbi:putative ABC transporter permease [Herbiconiux sp. YIM B11900]|uniref:putative ABC transporter permease n=1 Tax=Herbiconiux sp. YIM B11900 TaxID=3404131 RepID=UPI003F85484E